MTAASTNSFWDIFSNPVFMTAFWAWLAAQVIKVIIERVTTKKVDFKRLVGSGGMPSSHASFTVGLTVAAGLYAGWGSWTFAISAAFALVTMYDASGVRQAAGKQAAVLNEIVEMLQTNHVFPADKLKELIGHTRFEVVVGAVLGAIIALIVYYI